MKKLFRAIIFLGMGSLFVACGQSAIAIPSPIPSSTTTAMATFTPSPSQTLTATIEPIPSPTYVGPTLIPTIDPTLVPSLLKNAFSIQTSEGMNGHPIRQITGWDYGFGTTLWYSYCPGYVWLDTNHILLYPGAGQENGPEGIWGVLNVVPQPVVINLETGSVWLPPVDTSSRQTCNRVFWSHDLGVLINSGIYKGTPAVFTHTFDGKKLATYRGQFTEVSPSKEKILIDNNILIDLRTNNRITLAWSLEDYQEQMLSEAFWTTDETRLYRCCYFYADLTKGISHRFERSDFHDANGNHLRSLGLWFYRGQWVRNDTYFLVQWSWIDDGDIRYIPMFDPAKKLFYDVREMAGISPDLSCQETNVSTDGLYIWLECYEKNYLIDLTTFIANEYLIPGYSNADIDWSMDDKFALIQNYHYPSDTTQYFLLSLSNKEFNILPIVNPITIPWQHPLWHPTDGVFAYITEDAQKFELFDAQTMSFQELILPTTFKDFVWSPAGEYVALVAEDGSLWQVDYPNLERIEQLTSPLPNVSDVNWSPDGYFISFVSNSNVYIIEIAK